MIGGWGDANGGGDQGGGGDQWGQAHSEAGVEDSGGYWEYPYAGGPAILASCVVFSWLLRVGRMRPLSILRMGTVFLVLVAAAVLVAVVRGGVRDGHWGHDHDDAVE